MSCVINFSAGSAVLPESVLRQAADEMLDWHGSGMSPMEISHRGKEFIAIHAEAESLLRELMAIPPNYQIKARGGLAAMAEQDRAKAAILYDYLEQSALYSNPVTRADHSLMNVPFKLKNEALDDAFLKRAQACGMVQLKGHRSVGGMRASIYNAMPIEGVQALVACMKEFEAQHD
jgi:phosphoserine aminotransferase